MVTRKSRLTMTTVERVYEEIFLYTHCNPSTNIGTLQNTTQREETVRERSGKSSIAAGGQINIQRRDY
jgi:hypothetical protein